VVVSGRIEGNSAFITVSDNGSGIGLETARVFNETGEIASTTSGYGIKNVSHRIKLRFGGEYGVRIAEKTGGAVVTVCVPL
jgi:sensor histidine kinase YesM